MSQKITWSVKAAVADGPRLSVSQTVGIDAYGKIREVVDAATGSPGTSTIDLQPSGQAGAVRFLAITSDRYGKDLSFSVLNGGVSDVVLEGPLVLVGDGIDALLQKVPKRLTFSNGMDDAATIEIIVGREA